LENPNDKNDVIFLDDDDLDSPRGRELREYLGEKYNEDKIGHGAIAWFYPSTKNWIHR
jgi:hypothetical protein